jgi:NADPH-dependent ferric siderophore reductase
VYGTVIATAPLTPSMIRVVLGGDGLRSFNAVPYTDAYVNVAIPPANAPYSAPFDIERVRAEMPRQFWPARRRYTVRRWDTDERLLTLDILIHRNAGLGGRWAADARAGDALVLTGPAGAYRPEPDADWHLLVGDESAVPAIAASLEAIPQNTTTVVRLLVNGPDHEVELPSRGRIDLDWLHRDDDECRDATRLLEAVRSLALPSGRGQAFVHGEANEVREIRRHLLTRQLIERAHLSCSPYWRRHHTDEDWRRVKADWNARVERDVA